MEKNESEKKRPGNHHSNRGTDNVDNTGHVPRKEGAVNEEGAGISVLVEHLCTWLLAAELRRMQS